MKFIFNYFCSLALALVFSFFTFSSKAQSLTFTSSSNVLCGNTPTYVLTSVITSTIPNTVVHIWSINSNSCSTQISANNNSSVYHTLCPGVYTIYCTALSSTGGTLGVFSQAFGLIPANPTVMIAPNQMTCAGTTFTASYMWASSYTTIGGGVNITGNQVLLTPTATTCYTLLSSGTTCTATPFCLSVTSQPTVAVGNYTICNNASVQLYVQGATSYTWSDGTNTISPTVSPTVSTCYTVNATVGACGNATAVSCVSAIPAPVVSVVSGSACSGTSITYTALGATNYTWITIPSSSFAVFGTSTAIIPVTVQNFAVLGNNPTSFCMGYSGTITPIWTPSPTLSLVSSNSVICSGGSVTLTASGANTYSWNTSSTLSQIIVTPSSSTAYSVSGTNTAGCSATATASVLVNQLPVVSLVSTHDSLCVGQTATLNAGGATTYTWSNNSIGQSILVSPLSNSCYSVIGADLNGCVNSNSYCIKTLNGPTLNIIGNTTVCLGSSVTYSASGGTAYQWNGGAPGNSLTILPVASTIVTLTGVGANGCSGSSTLQLAVNTTCSDVWPGDANSDGVVSATDVFEIGLGFSSTGAVRSPGGNTYVAQHATNWTGTISSGKNLCHADCNGDGTINFNDTLAIFNNFGLSHSFKPSASATDPEISLVAPPVAFSGGWNVADVVVGNSTMTINQLYGVAFDLGLDANLIDDAYLVYTPSFLNAANQNVEFRKNFISNGKIAAATVRTNKSNVSGNGKIGELHYKVKASVAPNTQLNFAASNSQKINVNGVLNPLVPGAMTQLVAGPVGLKEQHAAVNVAVYPNPASTELVIRATADEEVYYAISDLSGRVVGTASFTSDTKVDVSNLANGVYFVEIQTAKGNMTQKVVVDHR